MSIVRGPDTELAPDAHADRHRPRSSTPSLPSLWVLSPSFAANRFLREAQALFRALSAMRRCGPPCMLWDEQRPTWQRVHRQPPSTNGRPPFLRDDEALGDVRQTPLSCGDVKVSLKLRRSTRGISERCARAFFGLFSVPIVEDESHLPHPPPPRAPSASSTSSFTPPSCPFTSFLPFSWSTPLFFASLCASAPLFDYALLEAKVHADRRRLPLPPWLLPALLGDVSFILGSAYAYRWRPSSQARKLQSLGDAPLTFEYGYRPSDTPAARRRAILGWPTLSLPRLSVRAPPRGGCALEVARDTWATHPFLPRLSARCGYSRRLPLLLSSPLSDTPTAAGVRYLGGLPPSFAAAECAPEGWVRAQTRTALSSYRVHVSVLLVPPRI
ncbi:hypothetical protein FB451DRAFT_1394783 [Mycena latifolia]|nr:hypothetical protein FB451DRAFT_1394783 [Mycena latifolia]